jgi:hypothetical protein
MFIPRIDSDGRALMAAPYRPIRMCSIPNPIFIPTDKLQMVLEP